MSVYIRTAVCSAVFFLFAVSGPAAGSQTLPEWVERLIENECENGMADPEELGLYFLDLLRSPMDVNTAGREVLSAFPLMTPFMVESLLDYREEYGHIASFSELSLVDGFSEEKVERLKPFITIGEKRQGPPEDGRMVSGELVLKSRVTVGRTEDSMFGSPFYRYLRYGVEAGNVAKAGFTVESDAGEKGFPDFCSISLAVEDIPFAKDRSSGIECIAVGDYSLRFGQGLALWSGFSMNSLSLPSSAIRNPSGIRSYTSSGETGFFRGGAVALKLADRFRISVFFSSVKRDAKTDGDFFTTLPDDGMHDSESALEAKGNLRETAGGANFSVTGKRFRVGVTAVAYGFDKKDGRRKSYYNGHLSLDGRQFNASADFMLSFEGLRLFGEIAVDKGWHIACIAGAVYPFSSGLEVSFAGRYYDYRYVALYSGAYSNTSCNNEYGASAALRYNPARNLAFTANAAYTRYPFHRFGVRGPSDVAKASADCDLTVMEKHNLYFKASCSYDNGRETFALRLRSEYTYSMPSGMEIISRVELCVPGEALGILAFGELRYTHPSEKFRFGVRSTFFSAEDWSSRIYCYEMNVPGTFSVPAYYGKGTGLYAIVAYKPVKSLNISLRCAAVKYAEASRDNLRTDVRISWLF